MPSNVPPPPPDFKCLMGNSYSSAVGRGGRVGLFFIVDFPPDRVLSVRDSFCEAFVVGPDFFEILRGDFALLVGVCPVGGYCMGKSSQVDGGDQDIGKRR